MPEYCTDDKWRFDYLWKKTQKRIEDLERKVDLLERKNQQREERDFQNDYNRRK